MASFTLRRLKVCEKGSTFTLSGSVFSSSVRTFAPPRPPPLPPSSRLV